MSIATAGPKVKLYSFQVAGDPSDFVLLDNLNTSTCSQVLGYFPSFYSGLLTPFTSVELGPFGIYPGALQCEGLVKYTAIPPGQVVKPDDQRITPVHAFSCEGIDDPTPFGGRRASIPSYGSVVYCECPPYPNWSWDGKMCVMGTVITPPPPTLIGYFNGVANTETTARVSLARLVREFPNTKAKPLAYDLFYNQTTCESGAFRQGKIPCLEDVAEVFDQRINELNGVLKNRWEYFWEILSGRSNQDGSLTATLTSRFGVFANAILQLIDGIYAVIINQLAGSFPRLITILNSKPTAAETAGHVAKLKTYADKGSGMVLIAHSQGNLFVNAAYDGIKASTPAAKVKVVHVAPASPTLRGEYVLADVDFVIRALRKVVGSGVPAVNINIPLSANDETGHAFEGTYLDITRNAYARLKAMITSALSGV